MGSRFCGKRYVMEEVMNALEKEHAGPVVRVYDARSKRFSTPHALADRISDAVRAGGYELPSLPRGDFFDPLDWLAAETGGTVHLAFANVDGMAHHVVREFLAQVRARVESGSLAVILSGECDFRNQVSGDGAEFASVDQYFLMGLDEDVFAEFYARYTRASALKIERPDAVRKRLWELTGGIVYLLRLLLTSAVELRARSEDWDRAAAPEEFEEKLWLNLNSAPMAYWAGVLHYSTRLISGDGECWQDLEELIANRFVEVPLAEGPPGALEFAGIAIRDAAGRRIVWASTIVEQLIARYYDGRRLADLYAQAGRWNEAFGRYSKLSREERIRPFDAEDKLDAATAVESLCATMHKEVEKGPLHLRNQLMEGARLLLGFERLSYWVLDRNWAQASPRVISPAIERMAEKLLPLGEQLPEGWLPLPGLHNLYAAAALFHGTKGRMMAVMISDFEDRPAMSRERGRLLRRLISDFLAAHQRAVMIAAREDRLRARDHHREVLNMICDTLSRDVQVDQVLRMAAEGLKKLDYFRVLICCVDYTREPRTAFEGEPGTGQTPVRHASGIIRGVVDLSDDSHNVNLATMAKPWPLSEPLADIQPYVVRTRKPKIVPDPENEPLVDPRVRSAARLGPLAVAPILGGDQNVIGTLHVERADRVVPTREEVADLLYFGRQLAAIIEQSGRAPLLQHALDRIASPVALADLNGNPLYANKLAAELFNVRPSWPGLYSNASEKRDEVADASEPQWNANVWGEHVNRDLKRCIQQDQRLVHHHSGIGVMPNYRGLVLCDKIDGWQTSTAAAVVHVQDLGFLEEVVDAFGKAAQSDDTESACKNLLQACLRLGAKAARLYLTDRTNPDLMVGQLWVGDGDEVHRTAFPNSVRFERRGKDDFRWLAMDTRTPKVFRFEKDGAEGTYGTTPVGLEYMVVAGTADSQYLPWKAGDFRVDLPVCTPDDVLGKITLECAPQLAPEQFEILKEVLLSIAQAQLGAIVTRDRKMHEHDELIQRSVAERVIAAIAHSLNTRLAALPGVLTMYKKAVDQPSRLPGLNRTFSEILSNALETVQRAKEFLGQVAIHPEPLDVCEHVETALRSAALTGKWTLHCAERPVFVEWDALKIDSALLELIRNSQQAVEGVVTIDVSIQGFERNGSPWVRIVYSDRGPGIPDEYKKEIFKHFFTRKAPQHSGTGLGLWFVNRVVEAHNGSIEERGKPGEGAEFVIEIPVLAQAEN